MTEEVATEPVNGEQTPAFRSRKAWTDVISQLKHARKRLDGLVETVARLANRCAAAEDHAWRCEAEIALLTSGLTPAQITIVRRMMMSERPTDIAGWLAEMRTKL